MKRFIDKSSTIDTFWRSIILLGNNVASYKFALGKTLINLSNTNTEIKIDTIALPFAKHVCEHFDLSWVHLIWSNRGKRKMSEA